MREAGIHWLDVDYVRPLIESLCQLENAKVDSGINEAGIKWLKMRSAVPVGKNGMCYRVAIDYWKNECLILTVAGLTTTQTGVQSAGIGLSKNIDNLFHANHCMYIRLEDESIHRYFRDCNDMLWPAAIDMYGWGDINKCLEQLGERKGGPVNFFKLK